MSNQIPLIQWLLILLPFVFSINTSAQHLVLSSESELINTQIADLNNDGFMDIATLSLSIDTIFANIRHTYTAMWQANDGNGNFSAPQVIGEKIHSYSPSGGYTYHISATIAIADNDGDGDNDIRFMRNILTLTPVFIPYFEQIITIFVNNGAGNFTEGLTQNLSNTQMSALTNINSDGIKDQLVLLYDHHSTGIGTSSPRNKVVYYAGNAAGTFDAAPITIIDSIQATRVKIADLNQDNISDIVLQLSTAPVQIVWYRGYGNGTFADAAPIASINADIIISFHCTDIDNNGTVDLLVHESLPDNEKIVWFSNNSDNFGNETVISLLTTHIDHFEIADIDQDNDSDILMGVGNFIYWAENHITSFASITTILYTGGTGLFRLAPIDNDINLELLWLNYSTDTLEWYDLGINPVIGDDFAITGTIIPDTLYHFLPISIVNTMTNLGIQPSVSAVYEVEMRLYEQINGADYITQLTDISLSHYIENIASGESIDISTEAVLLYGHVPPGNYYLKFTWTESFTDDALLANNTVWLPIVVAAADQYAVQTPTATVNGNETIDFNAQFIQLSPYLTYSPYTFYLSADATISADDIALVQDVNYVYDDPSDGSIDVTISLPDNLANGNYHLIIQVDPTLYESNFENNTASVPITIDVPLSTDAGINETSNHFYATNLINITTNFAHLNVHSSENTNLVFSICNINGSVIATYHQSLTKGVNELVFDVTSLPKGIYFLHSNLAEPAIRLMKF